MTRQKSQPFSSPSIWRDNGAVLPFRDIFLYPLQHSGFSVQVVHGNVKEPLNKCTEFREQSDSTKDPVKEIQSAHQWGLVEWSPAHLYLRSMQIHGNDVICTCYRQHVGHQLGRDRCSALIMTRLSINKISFFV